MLIFKIQNIIRYIDCIVLKLKNLYFVYFKITRFKSKLNNFKIQKFCSRYSYYYDYLIK